MSECTHDCGSCSQNCAERKMDPKDFLEAPHKDSKIKRVIGVVSGKGGVGKSLVTSLLAVGMSRRGFRTGVLDADITGPSIPKVFGVHSRAMGTEDGILPAKTSTGIQVMSVNMLLEDETAPVVWRGPIIAQTVKQFWSEVWQDVDFLFVDMPPGTGDGPLTVFQSLPVAGIVVVTSPQELVSMIVGKAVNMAKMMNIPILGLVENMSYVQCPDCGRKIEVFGQSHLEETAKAYDLPVLGRLPLDPQVAALCDEGSIELFDGDWLNSAYDLLEDSMK